MGRREHPAYAFAADIGSCFNSQRSPRPILLCAGCRRSAARSKAARRAKPHAGRGCGPPASRPRNATPIRKRPRPPHAASRPAQWHRLRNGAAKSCPHYSLRLAPDINRAKGAGVFTIPSNSGCSALLPTRSSPLQVCGRSKMFKIIFSILLIALTLSTMAKGQTQSE
jgi:hypothetical protein